MTTFIPVIRKDTEASSSRMSERIVVSAMREALAYEKVAQEIAPFKTNGKILGHSVLDDDAAVKALIKAAPEHLRNAIVAQKVQPYRMIQLLNRVLRAEFEMAKGNKLTGNVSPKKLAKLAALAAATAVAVPVEAAE